MKNPKRKDKFLEDKTTEEISEDVVNKAAIPEMIFKKNIFDCLNELVSLADELRVSKRLNGGSYNIKLLNQLEGKVMKLFIFIKYMLKEKKLFHLHSEKKETISEYTLCNNLFLGKCACNERELLKLVNYLTWGLHELNLTNLLKAGESSDFEKEFEKNW